MRNRKNFTVIILLLLFLQTFIGIIPLNFLNFNDKERNETQKIDLKYSDIIIGNYTVPGVSSPVSLNHLIRIGLLDDMNDITGDHAWKGALLAAKHINEAGGIDIYGNGTNHYIGLTAEDTDEANIAMDVSKGVAAANRMITYNNPHFIIGGYREEAVSAYQEVIMDAQIPFLSTGVSTDIFTQNVLNDYERYKYFFRIMPMNSTSLGTVLIYYLGFLCTNLGAIYGGTLNKVAIFREDLPWTEPLSNALNLTLGAWGITVVQEIAFPITATSTDFNTYWNMIESAGVQLTIPLVTEGSGAIKMIQQYRAVKPKCLLAGINLLSQLDTYWDYTEGACQYEITMQAIHRTNKTFMTIPFWDSFVSEYNMEPFYTGVGSYDAIQLLADVCDAINSFNSTNIITALEGFNKTNPYVGISAQIAFTSSHDLLAGYPYASTLFTQWQLDGKKVTIPSFVPSIYSGYYPSSLSTGQISIPYWGINNLVAAQDLPGDFILNDTADFQDRDGNFNLTWTNSTGADNYSVYMHDKSITYINDNLELLADHNAHSSYQISGLKTGKYYFVVVAYNGTGEKLSNNDVINVERPRPGNFTLTSDAGNPDTDGSFNLTWTDSEGVDNYSIFTYNHFITEINESVTILANQTATSPFPITGLSSGNYYFVVIAYNATGETISNNVNVTVKIPPGQFTLSSDAYTPFDTDGAFNLTWTESTVADNYSVYQYSRYITVINDSLIPLEIATSNTSFQITYLPSGTYYFIVMANNSYGYNLSNCINITIQIYDELSGYWILNPFLIDNTGVGDYTWLEVAALPWCSGSGTSVAPYIIEAIKINGQNSGSCIIVRNSSVYFKLRNCSCYNSGNALNDAGIKLINLTNGILKYINCSFNDGNGILLDLCQNVTITSSTVNNNSLNGIKLIDSDYINISDNMDTINWNSEYGISLEHSDYNEIRGNMINYNTIGVYLYESNYNTITDNDLTNNDQPYEQVGSIGNIIHSNLGVSEETPFPFDILIIVLIIGLVVVGVVGAVLIVKKRTSTSGLKKKEISEKKRLKIRRKLEAKLIFVDDLIKERNIKSAYKNLGKIQDTADQYEFFGIFNEATEKIEYCKDIQQGIYEEAKRESVITPLVSESFEKETQIAPVSKKVEEPTHNIFISYSTLDAEYFQINKIVKKLKKYPEIENVLYWERDSKENIVEFMDRTLKESDVFILFCSERSLNSAAVSDEWQAAFQRRKKGLIKMIPVYEDEKYVPPILGHLLNVKYTKDDFDSFIEKLHREILR